MKVQELMTRDARGCPSSATLNEAVAQMIELDCGSLPVVDGDEQQGRVIGVITDRDAALAAYRHGLALAEIPVQAAMSRNPVTVRPQEGIAAAERAMRDARVRRLPVVDGEGHLQGVLTLGQVALAAHRSQDADVEVADVGRTLAKISEPTPLSRDEPQSI